MSKENSGDVQKFSFLGADDNRKTHKLLTVGFILLRTLVSSEKQRHKVEIDHHECNIIIYYNFVIWDSPVGGVISECLDSDAIDKSCLLDTIPFGLTTC